VNGFVPGSALAPRLMEDGHAGHIGGAALVVRRGPAA
jgi:hypothetical protein